MAVTNLWAGRSTAFDFIGSADQVVESWFRYEWEDGAAACGIQPGELTDAERDALAAEINRQITYLIPFMNAITNGGEANGGSLTPLLLRVEMWVNDLGRIRQMAQNMACADQKAEWVIGPTEQHCPTCSFYAGKVYRRSVWVKYLEPLGLLPRTKGSASGLACSGFNCLCSLENTDKPATPGRPPIWKGPKTRGAGKAIRIAQPLHGRYGTELSGYADHSPEYSPR